jgi:zinc transporter 1/2/3
MFQNPCLGELEYEATAAAILIGGLLVSFLIEYIGQRYIQNEHKKAKGRNSDEKAGDTITHHGASEALNISVMEAGILFHSLRKFHSCPAITRTLLLTNYSHWTYPGGGRR